MFVSTAKSVNPSRKRSGSCRKNSYPFKILETKAQIGRDIRYQLTSEKQTPGGAYLLTVENLKQETGRYYDTIFLVTDSRVKPKISIQVYGKISGSGSPESELVSIHKWPFFRWTAFSAGFRLRRT